MRAPVAQRRHPVVAVPEENKVLTEHRQANGPATHLPGFERGIPVLAKAELRAVVEGTDLRAGFGAALAGSLDLRGLVRGHRITPGPHGRLPLPRWPHVRVPLMSRASENTREAGL